MASQLPLGFMVPSSDWQPPALSDLPQDWNAFKRITIDVETSDPKLRTHGIGCRSGGYICGFSMGFEDGPKHYLPIRHKDGGNLDPQQTLSYVRDNAKAFTGIYVNAHAAYDLDYMAEENIELPNVKFIRDPLVAEVLIDELQNKYNLDSVSLKYLGVGKDEKLLKQAAAGYGGEAKKIIALMHSKFVGPYGEGDGDRPMRVLRQQERIIDELGLQKVYDLESQVTPVLVRMRRRGVRVNLDKLEQIDKWARDQEVIACAEISRLSGYQIQPGTLFEAAQFAKAFDRLGIPCEMTKTGAISITAAWMESLEHPIGKALRWGRKMSDVRSRYVNNIRKFMIPQADGRYGRIHCTFNQLRGENDDGSGDSGVSDLGGAITGRLSAEDPNLQNQPGPNKDPEIGKKWRDIYEPEEGALFAVKDYSQQEPRWLVHWSICAGADRIGYAAHQAAIEFGRKYREEPDTDFHDMTSTFINPAFPTLEAKSKKKVRTGAKIVGLGRIYGRGGAAMCVQLGLPTVRVTKIFGGKEKSWEAAGEEGTLIINNFDREVPFAKAMLDADKKQAEELGYIRTHTARRLHFEPSKYDDMKYDKPYKALNKRIQGSAADQTKIALVELDRAGHYIQIQVHDEIDGSYADVAEAKRAAELMRDCVPMKVPSKVDLEIGPSWGSAKEIE